MQDQIPQAPQVIVSPPQIDIVPAVEKSFAYIAAHYPELFHAIKITIGYLVGLSIPLSVIFLVGIIISVERLKRIRIAEGKILNPNIEPGYMDDDIAKIVSKAPSGDLGLRWHTVLEHVDSANENDWRQAIIEADIMLEDMLSGMGYQGESIGDKLKRVRRLDFSTLDQAWEAHNVRNRIAHDGSEFLLNQHEAKRVIALYRQVFEEFFYIK